jgi:hypothetical protein
MRRRKKKRKLCMEVDLSLAPPQGIQPFSLPVTHMNLRQENKHFSTPHI